MIRGLWRSLAYNYREGGITQVINRSIAKPISVISSETSWLIYKINTAGYERKARLPLVQKELAFESLVQHKYYKALSFPERVRSRMTAGHRCFGFFDGDELANVGWISTGLLVLELWTLDITEDACSGIYDCYTFPAYRSKGIYTDTLIRLVNLLRAEEIPTVLISVDPGNVMSIRGIERAGFIPHYKLTRRRRFGRDSFEKQPFTAVCPQ